MLSTLAVLVTVFGSLHGAGILLDNVVGHIPITTPPDTVTATAAPTTAAPPKFPPFCHDLECPVFTTLEKNDKFEKRRYEPSVWVATEIVAMVYTKELNTEMFFKLFGYISGNNSQSLKIDMTAPVVTEIEHGPGPDCESNFTMHFLVPAHLHANTPQPGDPTVFIRRVPEMTVYVRSFGGFATDDTKRENLVKLSDDLVAANRTFSDNVFFTAGYDGPYAFIRHNEIWLSAM